MLGYLSCRKLKEEGFFFVHKEKDDHSRGNVFWADTTSRADYVHFGDVLAFDSFYRRNLYNTPLMMLVGVNHHHQSIVFGGAILQSEETESFVWLLMAFLQCMGKKEPKAVITDGNLALQNAIGQVFPSAIHRLCSWHVQQNVPSNLKCDDFMQKFKSCLMDRLDEEDFEQKWMNLLNEYDLHNDDWMQQMYTDRRMWAEGFLKETFFAGFRTTSQCEGMHSYMGDCLDGGMNLLEFVQRYDMGLERIRYKEESMDHENSCSFPIETGCLRSFQCQGAEIYTETSFAFYKKELEQVASYRHIGEVEVVGDSVQYKIRRSRKGSQVRVVVYDKVRGTVSCSFRLLESHGFPCRHIVCAVTLEDEEVLPSSCFLKRWTKMAERRLSMGDGNLELAPDLVQQVRLGFLTAKCNQLCQLASKSEESFDEICNELEHLTVRVAEINSKVQQVKESNPCGGVRDPLKDQTKGMPSFTVDEETNCRRCGICKQPGHTRATCEVHSPDVDMYDINF